MSKALFIDSNIAVYLFQGDERLAEQLSGHNIYISCLSHLELLKYPGLKKEEKVIIKEFIDKCITVQTNKDIIDTAVQLALKYNLKTVDSVIAASSYHLGMSLITADKALRNIDFVVIYNP